MKIFPLIHLSSASNYLKYFLAHQLQKNLPDSHSWAILVYNSVKELIGWQSFKILRVENFLHLIFYSLTNSSALLCNFQLFCKSECDSQPPKPSNLFDCHFYLNSTIFTGLVLLSAPTCFHLTRCLMIDQGVR